MGGPAEETERIGGEVEFGVGRDPAGDCANETISAHSAAMTTPRADIRSRFSTGRGTPQPALGSMKERSVRFGGGTGAVLDRTLNEAVLGEMLFRSVAGLVSVATTPRGAQRRVR